MESGFRTVPATRRPLDLGSTGLLREFLFKSEVPFKGLKGFQQIYGPATAASMAGAGPKEQWAWSRGRVLKKKVYMYM